MFSRQTLRQALVLSGLAICSISEGYIFGQMSGMVADLQSEDSNIPLSDSDISWIAATINATCVCGFGVATIVSITFGRRRTITILTMPLIAVWIMLYYAQNMAVLMITRVFVGLCFGGVFMLLLISAGEYASPNTRALFLNIITSVGPSVGTTVAHILSILLHWRTVALLGIIPAGLSALLPCFWVESPSWLASKGKYVECKAAFRALHERNEVNEKELNLLIDIEKRKLRKLQETSLVFSLKLIKIAITQRYFLRITLINFAITLYRAIAGKILFSTLAITMLQEMTGRSDVLLFTLLVDSFAILGGCLSCILISRMKMRTLLFSSALLANVFLIALSACLYFKSENTSYFPWINSTLLALYFITVNAGPYPVMEALYGEVYPLELKGYCYFIFGTVGSMLHFLPIRFASIMFFSMGYHGVFLFNVTIMSLCLVYLWVRLPETKGRTLQEIEMYFKNGTFEKIDGLLICEQGKVLM